MLEICILLQLGKYIEYTLIAYKLINFDKQGNVYDAQEEFEDTKGVIRILKSKKDRQYSGQKKKEKRTNNDLQNIHINLRSSNTNPTKTGDELISYKPSQWCNAYVIDLSVVDREFDSRSGQTNHIQLMFTVSRLITQHYGVIIKTCWLGVSLMCPNGTTYLSMDCFT